MKHGSLMTSRRLLADVRQAGLAWIAWLVLFVLLVGIGGWKAYQSLQSDRKGADALYYFAAAALLLALDRLKELERTKDGGWRAGFHEAIRSEVQMVFSSEVKPQLKEIGNLAASAISVHSSDSPAGDDADPGSARMDADAIESAQPGTSSSPSEGPSATIALPPPMVEDDPQKGRFGGLAQSRGRCLSASLDASTPNSRYFRVNLQVSRIDPATPPLEGSVTFHLHNTFWPSVQQVPVRDGVARLSLMSYGAFTVGAVVDAGSTLLELDLSRDTRFPEVFRKS